MLGCLAGASPGIVCNEMHFANGSGSLDKESRTSLDALARTLVANPDIELVQVEVHCDERDNATDNLELTEKRAQEIVHYLVGKHVPKARVRAMGFGEHCPIDPAHDEDAWASNRRTLFRIAKYAGIRGYDPLGCAAATALGVVSPPVP